MNSTVPPQPFVPSAFNLDRVTGLSGPALDLHLGLYRTYVKEANSLLEQLHDFPREDKLATNERLQRDGLVRRFCFEHSGVVLHESFFGMLSGPDRSQPGPTVQRSCHQEFWQLRALEEGCDRAGADPRRRLGGHVPLLP